MNFKESAVTLDENEWQVKELSAKHRSVLFDLYKKETNAIEVQAHIAKMGCQEFSTKEVDEIMEALSGRALDAISTEIMKISGMTVEELEEAEKN